VRIESDHDPEVLSIKALLLLLLLLRLLPLLLTPPLNNEKVVSDLPVHVRQDVPTEITKYHRPDVILPKP
jgi:hypothetical protein